MHFWNSAVPFQHRNFAKLIHLSWAQKMADDKSRRRLKSWRPIKLFSREENAKITMAILKIFAFCIDTSSQTVFPFLEHLTAFRNTNVSESLFDCCKSATGASKKIPSSFILKYPKSQNSHDARSGVEEGRGNQ
jgi:hypothetical protein